MATVQNLQYVGTCVILPFGKEWRHANSVSAEKRRSEDVRHHRSVRRYRLRAQGRLGQEAKSKDEPERDHGSVGDCRGRWMGGQRSSAWMATWQLPRPRWQYNG